MMASRLNNKPINQTPPLFAYTGEDEDDLLLPLKSEKHFSLGSSFSQSSSHHKKPHNHPGTTDVLSDTSSNNEDHIDNTNNDNKWSSHQHHDHSFQNETTSTTTATTATTEILSPKSTKNFFVWPKWAIDKSISQIEVLVTDDTDSCGPIKKLWVKAKPLSQIRGTDGNHYLNCEYEWVTGEGKRQTVEVFDEDFSPSDIRCHRTKKTVQEEMEMGNGSLLSDKKDCGAGVVAMFGEDTLEKIKLIL